MPNNQPQITPTNFNTPTIIYKPSEILGIIASYFSQQDVNKNVVYFSEGDCKYQSKNGEMPIDDSDIRRSLIDFYSVHHVIYEL